MLSEIAQLWNLTTELNNSCKFECAGCETVTGFSVWSLITELNYSYKCGCAKCQSVIDVSI